MRSRRTSACTVIAVVATVLFGIAAPAHADSHGGGSLSCAEAKKKVKKAKKKVRAAKPEGGKELKKAKRSLKKAKRAKRSACASSSTQRSWQDGRYQGTYAENNVDLAFNVVGTRLFTGPFDGFYLTATCQNVDPDYTGEQVYTDSSAIEPVEATIASNGDFYGEGQYFTEESPPMDWTIRGHISGGNVTNGEFSATYTDTFGNPCSGTTRFTASWYGDYTL